MFTIREATRNDAGLLARLGPASYRHHFAHLWRSADELSEFIRHEYAVAALQESLSDPTVTWLIGETHQPTGFAKMSWHRALPGSGESGCLLNKLYLSPYETGKGYGGIFFAEVMRLAKQRGERLLWLEVLEHNPDARRFYASFAMQHAGDSVFCTATQRSILHIMVKRLD